MSLSKNLTVRPLLALGLFLGAIILLTNLTKANDASPWLMSDSPVLKTTQDVVEESDFPKTFGASNLDCAPLELTRREGDLFPLQIVHKESQVSGCYIETSVGEVDPNGYANLNGTKYAADMLDENGNPVADLVFPNSNAFISNSASAPLGSYVWFNYLRSAVTFKTTAFAKILATFKHTGQTELTDKTGNPLPVMGSDFAVSDNGEWALVDSPGRGIIRINLETLEVLPFSNSFEFSNGVGSALRMAVTSDGRYAVVASEPYTFFKIYDLSTCSAVPPTISEPVACQSRDLNSFTRTKIGDMGGILHIKFLTNSSLEIYASHNISGNYTIGRYLLGAPGTSLNGMDYLGMGDSFSSGEGSQSYEIGTDVKDVNMCHLSTLSYPYLIAQKLALNGFHSVACSGAKTTNVVGGSGNSIDKTQKNRDNQFSKIPINNSLGTWLPGYVKQLNFVTENQPNLITLSALGNDLGFSDMITECVKPGTCYPTYEDRAEIFKQVEEKLPTVVAMYQKIKAAAPAQARIYAVGYPQIALSTGTCGLNVHMNESELTFAGSLISRIDDVVKTAAAEAGVHYADVEHALDGFRLCEAPFGKAAMNGLTAGSDIFDVIGNESFHPTGFGQYLMAQAILYGTDNLGQPVVQPDSSASLPALSPTDPSLVSLTKTNRPLNKRISIGGSVIAKSDGQHFVASLDGIDYALPPQSNLTVKLDDTLVGTITTDQNGSASVDIPLSDQEIHLINIYGLDLAGEPINLTTVTAASSESPCGAIATSGIDSDQDGIDDACDPAILATPTNPTPLSGTKAEDSKTTANITVASTNNQSPPNPPQVLSTSLQTNQNPYLSTQNNAVTAVTETAKNARNALVNQANLHPVRFLVALVTLLICSLILLGWQLGSHTAAYSVV